MIILLIIAIFAFILMITSIDYIDHRFFIFNGKLYSAKPITFYNYHGKQNINRPNTNI
jgi:hypothetical protein